MKTAILILAAGQSSRMGRPKQLLAVGNKSLLQLSIETALASSCKNVYCVLGAHTEELKEHIKSYPIDSIDNPNYKSGLSSSIRAGVEVLKADAYEAVLIHLADQPKITAVHLNALLDLCYENPDAMVATKYEDGLGVPAVFPQAHFNKLMALTGDKGARALLNTDTDQIKSISFSDLIDIDTSQDYQDFLKDQ